MFAQVFRILVAFSLCLSLGVSAASAESYSWTDKEGNKFYGSNPPRGARNVEKLKGAAFSKYSASKALAPYEKQLSRARMVPEKVEPKIADDMAPPLAAPSLEQGKIALDLSPDNKVASCVVDIKNSGDAEATNVTVSFEFVDGTIIQASGPEKISGGSNAEFKVPQKQLPVTIALEEGAVTVPEPSIIIQFSEAG